MSKSNVFETDLLNLIFRNIPLPADYGGTLYMSLHTADPGKAGDQTTGETTYAGYARVAVARDNTVNAFIVTGGTSANSLDAIWPISTDGPHILTHWAIGTAATGPGRRMYKFPLRDTGGNVVSVQLNALGQPRINAGELTVSEG
jgi:hypothetical protein